MNDVIGKDGIEKYLEKNLKGKDGVSSVVQNLDGKTSGFGNPFADSRKQCVFNT